MAKTTVVIHTHVTLSRLGSMPSSHVLASLKMLDVDVHSTWPCTILRSPSPPPPGEPAWPQSEHGHYGASSTFASHLFLPQLLECGFVYVGFLLVTGCIVVPMSYYVLGSSHLLILKAAAQHLLCELSPCLAQVTCFYLQLPQTTPPNTTPELSNGTALLEGNATSALTKRPNGSYGAQHRYFSKLQ